LVTDNIGIGLSPRLEGLVNENCELRGKRAKNSFASFPDFLNGISVCCLWLRQGGRGGGAGWRVQRFGARNTLAGRCGRRRGRGRGGVLGGGGRVGVSGRCSRLRGCCGGSLCNI